MKKKKQGSYKYLWFRKILESYHKIVKYIY